MFDWVRNTPLWKIPRRLQNYLMKHFYFSVFFLEKKNRIVKEVVEKAILKLKVKMAYKKNFIFCGVSILKTLR